MYNGNITPLPEQKMKWLPLSPLPVGKWEAALIQNDGVLDNSLTSITKAKERVK